MKPEKMLLSDLTVTQHGFRNEEQLTEMVSFVSSGGLFNVDSLGVYSNGKDVRLINISRFEDGRMYIHDGHHRVVSIYLGGRDYLDDSEYTIKDWKYSEYQDINLEKGWITPYDPRFEVRKCDYTSFKEAVNRITDKNLKAKINFIRNFKSDYVEPRRALTIQDMLKYL